MSDRAATDHLPDSTKLGAVELLVTDAERASAVWQHVAGLQRLSEHPGRIVLGLGTRQMIVLRSGAVAPRPAAALGLFHVAIHVPARRDIARTAARARAAGLRVSAQDHLLTQSIYFSDPDGNGIEFAFETPQSGRIDIVDGNPHGITADGRRHNLLEPIDVDSLIAELAGEPHDAGLPETSFIGHIHFRTAARDRMFAFYTGVIGFHPHANSAAFKFCDVGTRRRPHTVAFNTWGGDGLPPPPPKSAGVLLYTVELPAHQDIAAVRKRVEAASVPVLDDSANAFTIRDPEDNTVRLAAGMT